MRKVLAAVKDRLGKDCVVQKVRSVDVPGQSGWFEIEVSTSQPVDGEGNAEAESAPIQRDSVEGACSESKESPVGAYSLESIRQRLAAFDVKPE
ncbi:hypothetical protein [Magnetococcus marinus]|uniref:hypothetical protein n=1 Tax=Magnetococcus marinus TaxID=1124597 RepID=UPI00003C54BF|nr:hypothetical protein [Magnetococcus marinus]